MNQMTAEEYKKMLNQAEKRREKDQEILQIVNTLIVLQGDVLRRFMQDAQAHHLFDRSTPIVWIARLSEVIQHLNTNIKRTNESLKELGKAFGTSVDSWLVHIVFCA